MKEKLNENIVRVLINNKYYVTATDLANELLVNERTIRRRIEQINSGLSNSIGKIIAKKGRGYKLIIVDKDEFSKYYDYHIAEADMNNPVNRRTAIFEYIVDNKQVSKEELLNTFYISVTTLNNDISELNKYTSKVNVLINFSSRRGYYLEGDEYHIRNTILNLVYDSGMVQVQRRIASDMKKEVVFSIKKVLDEESIYINKHTLDAIVNYLLVTTRNLSRGRRQGVANMVNLSQLGGDFMKLASKLNKCVSDKMNTIFTYNETVFLAYFLKSVLPLNISISNDSKDIYFLKARQYTFLAASIMNEVGLAEMVEECKEDMIKFFYKFIIRVNLDIQKRKKIYLNIQITHPQAYCVSKLIFSEIEKKINQEVSREEIAYFALIVHHYYFLNNKKSKILAILPSDYTVARIYENELRYFVDYEVELIEYHKYSKIKELISDDYSLIINPFNNDEEISNITQYYIFDLVTREDILAITRILAYKDYNKLLQNLKKIYSTENISSMDDMIQTFKKRDGYYTTFLGSYIGFNKLEDSVTMSYETYISKSYKTLIVIINSSLSADEIFDLFRVAVDAIIKFRSTGEALNREELIEYYSR